MATAYETWAGSGSRLPFCEWGMSDTGAAAMAALEKNKPVAVGVPWPGEYVDQQVRSPDSQGEAEAGPTCLLSTGAVDLGELARCGAGDEPVAEPTTEAHHAAVSVTEVPGAMGLVMGNVQPREATEVVDVRPPSDARVAAGDRHRSRKAARAGR